MEQLFIDKIQTMIVESKTVTETVKALFNMGCPDSASDILDVYAEKEQEFIDFMTSMIGEPRQ